jgi:hypothetical protein
VRFIYWLIFVSPTTTYINTSNVGSAIEKKILMQTFICCQVTFCNVFARFFRRNCVNVYQFQQILCCSFITFQSHRNEEICPNSVKSELLRSSWGTLNSKYQLGWGCGCGCRYIFSPHSPSRSPTPTPSPKWWVFVKKILRSEFAKKSFFLRPPRKFLFYLVVFRFSEFNSKLHRISSTDFNFHRKICIRSWVITFCIW